MIIDVTIVGYTYIYCVKCLLNHSVFFLYFAKYKYRTVVCLLTNLSIYLYIYLAITLSILKSDTKYKFENNSCQNLICVNTK